MHPCNFDSAYKGFEIMMALCRSVLEGGQVPLPLAAGMDETAALRERLPDHKVLFGFEGSRAEYPEAG